MYSKEQKDMALQIYHQTRSVTKTIRILGYPTRRNLYTWILEENAPPVYSRKPHMIGLERQINGEKTLKRNTVLQYLRCILSGMDVQKKYSAVKKIVQHLSYIRKKAIVFAETIGCGNLVFGCPRNRSIPDNGDIEIALYFFKEIGDYAYEHHTVVAMGAMVENGETLDVLKGKSQLLNHVHISELGLKSIQHREIHNHLTDYLRNEI